MCFNSFISTYHIILKFLLKFQIINVNYCNLFISNSRNINDFFILQTAQQSSYVSNMSMMAAAMYHQLPHAAAIMQHPPPTTDYSHQYQYQQNAANIWGLQSLMAPTQSCVPSSTHHHTNSHNNNSISSSSIHMTSSSSPLSTVSSLIETNTSNATNCSLIQPKKEQNPLDFSPAETSTSPSIIPMTSNNTSQNISLEIPLNNNENNSMQPNQSSLKNKQQKNHNDQYQLKKQDLSITGTITPSTDHNQLPLDISNKTVAIKMINSDDNKMEEDDTGEKIQVTEENNFSTLLLNTKKREKEQTCFMCHCGVLPHIHPWRHIHNDFTSTSFTQPAKLISELMKEHNKDVKMKKTSLVRLILTLKNKIVSYYFLGRIFE